MFRLPLIERELRDVLKYIRPAVMEGVYVCGFLLAYIAQKEIVSCIDVPLVVVVGPPGSTRRGEY